MEIRSSARGKQPNSNHINEIPKLKKGFLDITFKIRTGYCELKTFTSR